jgi:hypothetical protein
LQETTVTSYYDKLLTLMAAAVQGLAANQYNGGAPPELLAANALRIAVASMKTLSEHHTAEMAKARLP